MIPNRQSPAAAANARLQHRAPGASDNAAWLRERAFESGVLLLGGASVPEFRVRVAQGHLRSDLAPSHWSMAGLLLDAERFLSVPLDVPHAGQVPQTNAVQVLRVADHADPEAWPNIAVLQFAKSDAPAQAAAWRIRRERAIVDLPSLLLPWLGYVWGAGASANPLMEGKGLPGAVLVESAYALAHLELTPGLGAASTCPEAIWQTAKWWSAYYEAAPKTKTDAKRAAPIAPRGEYAVRQTAAAVSEAVLSRLERALADEQPKARRR